MSQQDATATGATFAVCYNLLKLLAGDALTWQKSTVPEVLFEGPLYVLQRLTIASLFTYADEIACGMAVLIYDTKFYHKEENV